MEEQVADYAFALIEKPFNLSDVGTVTEMVEVALN
jgi:hypothetical protein